MAQQLSRRISPATLFMLSMNGMIGISRGTLRKKLKQYGMLD